MEFAEPKSYGSVTIHNNVEQGDVKTLRNTANCRRMPDPDRSGWTTHPPVPSDPIHRQEGQIVEEFHRENGHYGWVVERGCVRSPGVLYIELALPSEELLVL